MRMAGADAVVSPNRIGGLRNASQLVRPTVVSFLDKMLYVEEKALRVEEAKVNKGSSYIGKKLGILKNELEKNLTSFSSPYRGNKNIYSTHQKRQN
jgi:Trk K+ transport system NAD-binding subunit